MLGRRLSRAGQRRYVSQQTPAQVNQKLREILRETAQPVAVVTSLMPLESKKPGGGRFHGATLSSFTSIAMHPVPLVSFALRVPSRMGTALNEAREREPKSAHMVINLLCAAQAAEANKFARPDLYPDPFASTAHVLTEDGLPMLEGCLGAITCRMVGYSWPLSDMGGDTTANGALEETSELFVASVTRVESVPKVEGTEDTLRTLPLLYRRRGYVTCLEIASQR